MSWPRDKGLKRSIPGQEQPLCTIFLGHHIVNSVMLSPQQQSGKIHDFHFWDSGGNAAFALLLAYEQDLLLVSFCCSGLLEKWTVQLPVDGRTKPGERVSCCINALWPAMAVDKSELIHAASARWCSWGWIACYKTISWHFLDENQNLVSLIFREGLLFQTLWGSSGGSWSWISILSNIHRFKELKGR